MVPYYAYKDYTDVCLTNQQKADHAKNWSIAVRTSWQRAIPPFSESPVRITTSAADLVTLDPQPSRAKDL